METRANERRHFLAARGVDTGFKDHTAAQLDSGSTITKRTRARGSLVVEWLYLPWVFFLKFGVLDERGCI